MLHLKPLTELLIILGPNNTMLTDKWKRDVKIVLRSMIEIFPIES